MSEDLSMEVGRQGGKIEALTARLDRHETAVWSQLGKIDVKLDGIAATLATNSGERRGSSRLLHWILTIAGMAIAWFAGSHPPGGAH